MAMAPRITVVEDEEALSVLLRYNLEAEGYEVDTVLRGDEAEIRLQEMQPDLLILDWMLPGLSGIELCRRLRAREDTERLPVIMLTARGEEAERIRGLSTGADDYVVKPFSVPELMEEYGLSLNELMPYLPVDYSSHDKGTSEVAVHYLGYYIKWVPQEAYYYAVEHTGFRARPFRTEGTYSKYNSIDDKLDDLHYYTTYIKFGLGRATYDAAQEIRNRHLTREEGVALVQRFDGEFPYKYFEEVLKFLDVNPKRFLELCDEFRSPHLWELRNDKWELRHQVS